MSAARPVKVWDPAVRVGHWLLVVLFAVAYVTGEADFELLHAYAGYGVLGVVVLRLFWGFAGTRYARFTEFLRGPRATLAYLKSFAAGRPAHYLGHNPAGGYMIVLLLAMLLASVWTGLETYGEQGKGPLAKGLPLAAVLAPAHANGGERAEAGTKRRRSAAERFWKELHEGFANATLLLVLLHVAGAIAASIVHRENLVRAMITGYKSAAPPE
jgi:cytochrome b